MNSNNEEIVSTKNISCSGGEGPLGHPKIYLTISQESVICPYCGKKFIYDDSGVE